MSMSAQKLITTFGELKTAEEVRQAQALLNRRLAEIGQQAMQRATEQGIVPGARVEVLTSAGWVPGAVESTHAQTATVHVPGYPQRRFPPSAIRLVKN